MRLPLIAPGRVKLRLGYIYSSASEYARHYLVVAVKSVRHRTPVEYTAGVPRCTHPGIGIDQ